MKLNIFYLKRNNKRHSHVENVTQDECNQNIFPQTIFIELDLSST